MNDEIGQTMDFFGHQDQAQRKTKLLVFYYCLAVGVIITIIYIAAVILFRYVNDEGGAWNPWVFLATTVGVLAVVGAAMAFKTNQLSQGGSKVARLLGGRQIHPGTKDATERQLHNVVEEMAIASGVPVPDVFVLREEQGLNAFAAGWGTDDAAIGVTQGLLDTLSRDELQGVIAHEFSHIFHGDSKLNIRLMGVLFGIVCIATIGEIMVRMLGRGSRSSRDNKGAGAIVLFGLVMMLVGWIGVFFAGLIKAAVSRQREYLADASAVAYTRNPRGIGLALARIGGLGSKLGNAHAREASHMFFADGIKRFFGGLGATHPPIRERIERVLPGFTKRVSGRSSLVEAVEQTPAPAAPAGASGFAAGGAPAAAPRATRRQGRAPVEAAAITQMVGQVEPEVVARAREFLEHLPLDVVAAAHEPERARALLYALLLDPAADATGDQTTVLDGCAVEVRHEARSLAAALRDLPDAGRLPLLEILIPALRRLPAADIDALRREATELAQADGVLTPFEFALLKTVRRHVKKPGELPRRRRRRRLALSAALREAELVLSVLARAGGDAAEAADAFAAGAAVLEDLPGELRLRPAAECKLDHLDAALDVLAEVTPFGKKLLLTACAHAAGADGLIEPAEGELLRAFAESWECPLPPVWTGAREDADAETSGD